MTPVSRGKTTSIIESYAISSFTWSMRLMPIILLIESLSHLTSSTSSFALRLLPLASVITILSFFTEAVALRYASAPEILRT